GDWIEVTKVGYSNENIFNVGDVGKVVDIDSDWGILVDLDGYDKEYFVQRGLGDDYRVIKEEELDSDSVNHPSHYTTGKFETIEVIEHIVEGYSDPFVSHCVGTATKYLDRAPYKHEDITE